MIRAPEFTDYASDKNMSGSPARYNVDGWCRKRVWRGMRWADDTEKRSERREFCQLATTLTLSCLRPNTPVHVPTLGARQERLTVCAAGSVEHHMKHLGTLPPVRLGLSKSIYWILMRLPAFEGDTWLILPLSRLVNKATPWWATAHNNHIRQRVCHPDLGIPGETDRCESSRCHSKSWRSECQCLFADPGSISIWL